MNIEDAQEQLVQAIVVHKGRGTHEEVVQAVAKASVLAWLQTPELPSWEHWLSGRFTKTVRRASPAQIEALAPMVKATVTHGDVEAFAFEPMVYEDFPKPLAKAQVQGTDFPRAPSFYWSVDIHGPVISLNKNSEMTTGKTAAQVAHAMFGWVLRQPPEVRERWLNRGMHYSIYELGPDAFEESVAGAEFTIEDAGFTEIEPGTITAAVRTTGDYVFLTRDNPIGL